MAHQTRAAAPPRTMSASETDRRRDNSSAQPPTHRVPLKRPTLPLVGDTQAIVSNPYGYAATNFERYGYAWQTRFMFQPAVVVVGEEIHRLFAQEPTWFSNHAFYQFLEAVLGVNLLSMSESQHAQYRPHIGQGISMKQDAYVPLLNATLQDELGRLPNAGVIDFAPIARRITFRIGVQLVLGIAPHDPRVGAFEEHWAPLRAGIFTPVRLSLPGITWSRSQHARRQLQRLLLALINEYGPIGARSVPDSATTSNPPSRGVLAHLMTIQATQVQQYNADVAALRSGTKPPYQQAAQTLGDLAQPMTDAFICDQLLSVLFASDDTTSGVLAWLLTHVAFDQELQQRLAQEHVEAPDAFITPEQLRSPLVSAVVQENARLHHIASMVGRKVEHAFDYVGVHIPANVLLLSMSGYTQRMKQYFSDPLAFRPERFLPGGDGMAHPNALFPFGGGAHGCLGKQPATQELAGTLIYFTRRWSYRLAGKQALPPSAFLPSGRPESSVRLELSPRS